MRCNAGGCSLVAQGENLLLSLQEHGLNIIAMDGITTSAMITLPPDLPLVMSPGQRYDVLVKAGAPGTYQLEALDPGFAGLGFALWHRASAAKRAHEL